MAINWILKSFPQLSTEELYALLRLRNIVFVVEQDCPYLDTDGKDQASWHLMAFDDNRLVAYTRIIPPGISYEEVSIGRVVTAPEARGSGIGRELMEQSLRHCETLFGQVPIRIGAQQYLERFYASLGFISTGEPYLDDGIPHIEMLLSK